jgi:hypothetical protein
LGDSFDILLVEDNADLAGNIIDYLEALGHRLHTLRMEIPGYGKRWSARLMSYCSILPCRTAMA